MAKRAFVTGYPITHSRSPLIHRYWLKVYGLEGSYDPIEIVPENYSEFIRSLSKRGLCGGNVTLPYKEETFLLAHKRDDVATGIGAVNTLWFEGETLCASNTDAYGFAANLDDFAPGWAGGTALVLGAGGAARAVVYALKQRQFDRIILLNRTKSRAVHLAERFGIDVGDWSAVNSLVHQADLVVNTTSLGMENHLSQSTDRLFIDFSSAKPKALVTDLIYTPLETPILLAAKAAGLKTVDGLGMLLHQAVPGFERWFGKRPDVTKELRDMVLRNIGL